MAVVCESGPWGARGGGGADWTRSVPLLTSHQTGRPDVLAFVEERGHGPHHRCVGHTETAASRREISCFGPLSAARAGTSDMGAANSFVADPPFPVLLFAAFRGPLGSLFPLGGGAARRNRWTLGARPPGQRSGPLILRRVADRDVHPYVEARGLESPTSGSRRCSGARRGGRRSGPRARLEADNREQLDAHDGRRDRRPPRRRRC